MTLIKYENNYFFLLTFFWGYFDYFIIRTKYVDLSSNIHFLSQKLTSWFFLTFSFKYYLYNKFMLSYKDYLILIYKFIGMLIFWRSIHLSFQSHQMCSCTFSAGLGIAQNRDGLSCNYIIKKNVEMKRANESKRMDII